jgi:hypothetical protein
VDCQSRLITTFFGQDEEIGAFCSIFLLVRVLSRIMLVHDLVPYLSSSVSSELKNIEREGWELVESGSTWTLISDETPPLMRWLIELDLDLSESTFLATFNLDPFDEEKVRFDCAALLKKNVSTPRDVLSLYPMRCGICQRVMIGYEYTISSKKRSKAATHKCGTNTRVINLFANVPITNFDQLPSWFAREVVKQCIIGGDGEGSRIVRWIKGTKFSDLAE